jgi:hypothetical protein
MALHRLIHATPYSGEPSELLSSISNVFKSYGGHLFNKTNHRKPSLDIQHSMGTEFANFLSLTMTTRSAREKILFNSVDFLPELFAQHHLGGIKLLRTKDWINRFPEIEEDSNNSNVWKTVRKMLSTPAETDLTLSKVENYLNEDIKRFTQRLVGKNLIL